MPRQDQSGNLDKQLPITKAGSTLLRTLLKHPEREYVPLSETNQKLLERLAEEQKAMEGHSEAVEAREAAER